MAYFDQTDLENALGKQTVRSIYDDTGDQVVNETAMAACCAYGTSEVNSFIRGEYPNWVAPTVTPDELKFAAIAYGCEFTTRRRPDLVSAMGAEPWTTFRDSANERMKRYVTAMQRLPADLGAPSNVGGSARSGDPINITPPPKVFANGTGDF